MQPQRSSDLYEYVTRSHRRGSRLGIAGLAFLLVMLAILFSSFL